MFTFLYFLLTLVCMFVCFSMFKARERIVGWYHTGPKLHHNDVKVNELIRRYCSNSVSIIYFKSCTDIGLI